MRATDLSSLFISGAQTLFEGFKNVMGKTLEIELTEEEKRAIRTLSRLANNWPESLILFSAGGSLNVVKVYDGEMRTPTLPSGGVDQDRVVASISGIPNEGGDW